MRAKIAPNIIKLGVHAYLSNWYLNPLLKLNCEKVDKSAYFECWFDLTSAKTTPNLIKIGVHAYLSNGYINPVSKLNSEKIDKSASCQHRFDQC